MAEPKIYLNVPYQEKDAAKGLGARWDAAQKKWYILANQDASLFAKWQLAATATPVANTNKAKVGGNTSLAAGIFTYPIDKNIVAYNGDLPPWDD